MKRPIYIIALDEFLQKSRIDRSQSNHIDGRSIGPPELDADDFIGVFAKVRNVRG
jgi:hypothetical protein